MSDHAQIIHAPFRMLREGVYVPFVEHLQLYGIGSSSTVINDKQNPKEKGTFRVVVGLELETHGDPFVPEEVLTTSTMFQTSMNGYTPLSAEGMATSFFRAFLISYSSISFNMPSPPSDAQTNKVYAPLFPSPKQNPVWILEDLWCIADLVNIRGVEVRNPHLSLFYQTIVQAIRITPRFSDDTPVLERR